LYDISDLSEFKSESQLKDVGIQKLGHRIRIKKMLQGDPVTLQKYALLSSPDACEAVIIEELRDRLKQPHLQSLQKCLTTRVWRKALNETCLALTDTTSTFQIQEFFRSGPGREMHSFGQSLPGACRDLHMYLQRLQSEVSDKAPGNAQDDGGGPAGSGTALLASLTSLGLGAEVFEALKTDGIESIAECLDITDDEWRQHYNVFRRGDRIRLRAGMEKAKCDAVA
jgi:hypothetical protein